LNLKVDHKRFNVLLPESIYGLSEDLDPEDIIEVDLVDDHLIQGDD
jgi:hypothetical protein